LVPGAVHDKTIRAKTKLSCLAMDEETLKHLMAASHEPPPLVVADIVMPMPIPDPAL
jgi:hypothetical protein